MGRGTRVREPETKDYPQAPEGLHPAVCVDVWEIWTEQQSEEFGGGLVDKTRLIWQIDQTYENDKGETVRYEVMMTYTASLHEKANLRQHLKSWRGRDFTKEELLDFELENIVGVNCQLQVLHHISQKGKKYAKVATIVPSRKGDEKLIVTSDFIRKKDRKKDEEAPAEEFVASNSDVPFGVLLPFVSIAPLLASLL
jgi:hypothetical protein